MHRSEKRDQIYEIIIIIILQYKKERRRELLKLIYQYDVQLNRNVIKKSAVE